MNEKFGRALRHYRRELDLNQKELAEALCKYRGGGDEIQKGRISKWEHGQVPDRGMIEDLESVLVINGQELLKAAGYSLDLAGAENNKADVSAKLRIEHLQRLTEIAEQLLANDLDTVTENKPSSVTGETESADWSSCKYWIGYTAKRGIADDKALSQMLSDNWDSLSRSRTKTELNCFMYHVDAEFDDVAKDRLITPEALYRHLRGFKYLRINNPYKLIVKVRNVAGSLRFRGTCPVCKNWET